MIAGYRLIGAVSDEPSGGAHTSRTMMLGELGALLSAVGGRGSREDYRRAILADNVLSKGSTTTRRRSLRYLRQLYVLDPASPLFRGLTRLWEADSSAQPLLALICALSCDPLLRATVSVIIGAGDGQKLTSDDLAQAVTDRFPDSYSQPVAAKIGRNAVSSWTQSGHLRGRLTKVRVRATPRPASTAYALFVGHLGGAAGAGLFDTVYAHALDCSSAALHDEAFAAAKRGWIDFRQAGQVVEVGFRWLGGELSAEVT